MTKTILSLIGGFIAGVLIIWGWNSYTDRNSVRDIAATTTAPTNIAADTELASVVELDSTIIGDTEVEAITESSSITVLPQAYGSIVNVASVTLESNGWIVVHEEKEGLIANALGAARRDVGTHSNIMIPLLRDTLPSARYWIVLYTDDGDRQFNLVTDFPLRNSAEEPITSSFKTQ